RGSGLRAHGGITLAIYARYLHDGRPDGPPMIDSLDLSAQEVAALRPPRIADGASWQIPESIARKLVRALSPNSDQSTMPRPEDATKVTLSARTGTPHNGVCPSQITGRLDAIHLCEGDAKRPIRAGGDVIGEI